MSEPVLFVLLSRTDSSPCIFFECKQFRAVLFLFALSAMKGFGRRGGGFSKGGQKKETNTARSNRLLAFVVVGVEPSGGAVIFGYRHRNGKRRRRRRRVLVGGTKSASGNRFHCFTFQYLIIDGGWKTVLK